MFLLSRIRDSNFFKNVLVVASGTAFAQAITMGFSPLITRMYGPEAFGTMGAYAAILMILTPLMTLSYPMAIVLAKTDEEAHKVAKLSILLASATAIFLSILFFFGGDLFSDFLGWEDVRIIMWLAPAAFFVILVQIGEQWAMRTGKYKEKSKAEVFGSFATNSMKTGGGFFFPSALTMVVLSGAGAVAQIYMQWFFYLKKEVEKSKKSSINNIRFSSIARKYFDFALYRTPQIVLAVFSQSMPIIILSVFFGAAPAGFYALGRSVLGVPGTLIGNSVAAVFYPKINRVVSNGGDARKVIVEATLVMAGLGVLPFGAIIALGPWIFPLVFGGEWAEAGVYAQWLSLWLYFSFISRPVIAAIPVLKMQGFFLMYEFVALLFRLGALAFGFYWQKDPLLAVAIFSLVNAALSMIIVFLTINYSSSFSSFSYDS